MRRETKRGVLEFVVRGVLFAIVAGGGYWIISNQLKKEDDITSRDYRTQKIERVYESEKIAPKPQRARDYINQEIALLKENNNLAEIYNSIDLSKISDEEREWLATTKEKDLKTEMNNDLTEETLKTLDEVCGLKHLSKQDHLFLFRIFTKIYEQMDKRDDIFEMQR